MQYKILRMKTFQGIEKFEQRLNQMSMEGWRVITSMNQGAYLVMGKEKH